MINRVILVGRITRDPELKKTATGGSSVNFTIALDNIGAKGPNGEKTTSFIKCAAWNQQAENLYKFVRKGSLIGVEGRLRQRTYDSKDGRKVEVVEVMCDSIQFLESKGTSTSREENEGYEPDPVPSDIEERNIPSIDVATDDDLPF